MVTMGEMKVHASEGSDFYRSQAGATNNLSPFRRAGWLFGTLPRLAPWAAILCRFAAKKSAKRGGLLHDLDYRAEAGQVTCAALIGGFYGKGAGLGKGGVQLGGAAA